MMPQDWAIFGGGVDQGDAFDHGAIMGIDVDVPALDRRLVRLHAPGEAGEAGLGFERSVDDERGVLCGPGYYEAASVACRRIKISVLRNPGAPAGPNGTWAASGIRLRRKRSR